MVILQRDANQPILLESGSARVVPQGMIGSLLNTLQMCSDLLADGTLFQGLLLLCYNRSEQNKSARPGRQWGNMVGKSNNQNKSNTEIRLKHGASRKQIQERLDGTITQIRECENESLHHEMCNNARQEYLTTRCNVQLREAFRSSCGICVLTTQDFQVIS